MRDMERWSTKVALVTGASSGIGEAIARVLSSSGMRVALAARRVEKLENIANTSAKAIINGCPFCHLQFDRGQKDLGDQYKYPVIHVSQLLALAMGLDSKVLGFQLHETPVNL